MARQPIIRGHRLPAGVTASRGTTSPITVQRVMQINDIPEQDIATVHGDMTIEGTWHFVPVGTDEVTELAVGDLNGEYGYSVATYGVAIGEYATGRPNITIDDVNGLRIRNYTTNVLTLDLAGNASFAGAVTAASGTIGGWTIGAADLTGGDAKLASAGKLTLGAVNDVVVLDAADANYRLWAGNAVGASAPFSVTKAGVLRATGATIEGALTATTGELVDLDVSGVLDLVSGGAIQSDNYSAGMAGWRVNHDGSAEFGDVVARGTLKATVFEKGQVSATAGSLYITKSAGKLAADYTVDGTLTIETPDAGGFLFETDDIVRITAINTAGNLTTTWITVTRTGTTNAYTTAYASGTNSVTYPTGSVAVDYGASGDGVLTLTADDANGPFYSVQTHSGAPYTALTERVRIGNLNGSFGRSSDLYGIGIGDYAAGNYLSYDATNGFVLRSAEGNVQLSDNGLQLLSDAGEYSQIKWHYSAFTGTLMSRFFSHWGGGSTDSAIMWLLSERPVGAGWDEARIVLRATDGISSTAASVEISSTSLITLQSDDVSVWHDMQIDDNLTVKDGINVGSATGAGTGNIRYSGGLESYKGSTAYGVYGARFLTTQLTSTAWDGDAKTSANNGTIDLSEVFGVPAGVKAVLVAMNVYSAVGQVSLALKPDSDASNAPPLNIHTIATGYTSRCSWVPCDANGDIYFSHSSSDSVNVWIEIWGYAI